jgi:hypothetical protein
MKTLRELAEWFKAVSLSFIKLYKLHPFKSDILCLQEHNLIGKIGSFNLQFLGSNPSTLGLI